MHTLLVAGLFASAVTEIGPEPSRVLLSNLETVDVTPEVARLFNGSLAEALQRAAALEVVTTEDIAQIADLEAERQALQCDAASCFAEIASALGARYVIFGTTTRVDDIFVIQLTLLDAKEGRAIGRRSARDKSPLLAADAAKRAVAELVRPLLADDDDSFSDLFAEPKAEVPPPAPLNPALVWGGVAGAGVIVVVAGGAMAIAADQTFSDIAKPTPEREASRSLGQVGVITLVVGAVVAATAGGVLLWTLTAE